jgi:hypothetical protein
MSAPQVLYYNSEKHHVSNRVAAVKRDAAGTPNITSYNVRKQEKFPHSANFGRPRAYVPKLCGNSAIQ